MIEDKFMSKSLEDGTEVQVTIKQEDNTTQRDSILKAINLLMDSIDLKNTCNADYNVFEHTVEEILYKAADIIGYEHYYWEHVPESETHYVREDLVVSKKAKVDLLKQIVADMEKKILE